MIDALGSVSEFSIGLAGFSGVAAALLQRNRSLQEIDRLRVTINVVVSLTPGIWALVLIALLEMGVPVERAVRWASVGFLTTHLGWIAVTQWMLSKLPDETIVCGGHNYTAENHQFALTIEPDNKNIKECLDETLQLEKQGKPFVTNIAKEKETNIFLLGGADGFSELRKRKDCF